MKKLFLIALAFVSLQVIAQDRQKGDIKEMKKNRTESMKNISPEDMATISTKKLTLALDLNENQQTQVKELLLTQAKSRMTLRDKRVKSKEKEAKKITKEERVQAINSRLDDQIVMKKKMKSILTTEQYEKWEKIQARRGKEKRGKQKIKKKQ